MKSSEQVSAGESYRELQLVIEKLLENAMTYRKILRI